MTQELLAVDRLGLVRDGRSILSDLTLRLVPGEFAALTGASGAGKTTLVRAIAGLDTFASGNVRVGDVTLQANARPLADARRRLHRNVGVVFQFHHLFANLTALDNVRLALMHVHGHTREEATSRSRALLDRLGVAHREGAYPHTLSGGEAQRVAIARALAVDPPLLLLDEPTASLDHARRAELGELLRGLVAEKRTLLVATHDLEFVRMCATRVVALADGRLQPEPVGPAVPPRSTT